MIFFVFSDSGFFETLRHKVAKSNEIEHSTYSRALTFEPFETFSQAYTVEAFFFLFFSDFRDSNENFSLSRLSRTSLRPTQPSKIQPLHSTCKFGRALTFQKFSKKKNLSGLHSQARRRQGLRPILWLRYLRLRLIGDNFFIIII